MRKPAYVRLKSFALDDARKDRADQDHARHAQEVFHPGYGAEHTRWKLPASEDVAALIFTY
jgi:hypothetical protein